MKFLKDVGFDRLCWEKGSNHMEPPPVQDPVEGTWYLPIYDRDESGAMIEVDRIEL